MKNLAVYHQIETNLISQITIGVKSRNLIFQPIITDVKSPTEELGLPQYPSLRAAFQVLKNLLLWMTSMILRIC